MKKNFQLRHYPNSPTSTHTGLQVMRLQESLASRIVSDAFQNFSLIQNFGYIASGFDMNLLRERGKKLGWNHVPHLNQLGNEVVAEGIFKWIEKEIEEKLSSLIKNN